MSGRIYDRAAWQTARRFVLARDGYRCRTPGCGSPTKIVDHVIPLSRGGPALDPANLVARCAKHNGERSVEFAGAGWPTPAAARQAAAKARRPRRVWHGALG